MRPDGAITRRGFLQRGGALAVAARLGPLAGLAQKAGWAQGADTAPAGQPARGFEAVLKKYPRLPPAPFGRGIFAHVRGVTGEQRFDPKLVLSWAEHPYVTGTQLSYCWTELEPAEGQCRWDIIEKDMDQWAKYGKKCWIEISTAGRWWRGTPFDPATPKWVFDKGAPFVKAPGTATYPVFWDPRYLEKWGQFLHALAAKFDGDPRVEYVATGGYSNGTEPRLSAKEDDKLMDQWTRNGFDGMTANGVYLTKGIKPVLKLFRDAFKKTPVGQTYIAKGEFSEEMNRYAACDLKFHLTSNGQGMKSATAEARQAWRERREKYGVKVGYAEWGPSGRIVDEEQFRLKKEKKQQQEKSGDYKSAIELDKSKMAKLSDAYRGLIGDDGDPKLKPSARISFLAMGERFPEAETQEEWSAALKWAWEHLEA